MPAELWNEAARMAGCGLLIAAVAVPVGLLARQIAKRLGEPLLPRPRRWPVPWSGFELLILFPFAAAASTGLVDPLLDACGFYSAVYGDAPVADWAPMRPLWSAAIFAPLGIGMLWLLVRLAYPNWRAAPGASPAASVAGGIGTWLVLHPIVGVIHFTMMAAFLALAWQPDPHPLETSFRDGRSRLDETLFAFQVAVATPWLEEVLFRGALLPWLLGKRSRPAIVVNLAVVLAAALSSFRLGPSLFAVILLAGGVLLHMRLRVHRRTVGAIYASAALFAVVHSPVWPSPIPLFLLGLGLGWIAVRTRGLIAPVLVHGLFNAVSVLFVLRS